MAQPTPTRKRRAPLERRPAAPTGRPSPEACPVGQRWPFCVPCRQFAASIGHDRQSGRDLAAYVLPERARELGWSEVKLICPGCHRVPLGARVVHAETEGADS